MLTKSNPMELLVDSHHGIYVPQIFAETVRRELFGDTISPVQYAILRAGPEDEYYWDVWDEVLSSAETEDGISLHQDGDLWIVNWSLIGNEEEIAEIGAMALAEFNKCDQRRGLLGELWASLRDGPSFGRWNRDMLSTLRDMVEQIADRVSDQLPMYYSTDFGIAERGFDVEKLMIAESPALTEISKYW
jgi:hypothetical protein